MPELTPWERAWLATPSRYASWSDEEREVWSYIVLKYLGDFALAAAIYAQTPLPPEETNMAEKRGGKGGRNEGGREDTEGRKERGSEGGTATPAPFLPHSLPLSRRWVTPPDIHDTGKLRADADRRRVALTAAGCQTYTVGRRGGEVAIVCLCCGLGSANHHDLAEKFCGFCRAFHAAWRDD